jgi:GAF domain-containing protein
MPHSPQKTQFVGDSAARTIPRTRAAGLTEGTVRPVVDLTATDEHPRESELWVTLSKIAKLAAGSLPGADGAGVALVLDDDVNGRGAASDAFVWVLEAQQAMLNEGPSRCALQTCRAQQSDHLATDSRWLRFGHFAAGLGIHSAISLPLVAEDGNVRGTLDLYARSPRAFASESAKIGAAFAESAMFAVHNSRALERSRRLVLNLNDVMCGRQDIDTATGILMARAHCSRTDAVSELKDCAEHYGGSVEDAARALVNHAVETAEPVRNRVPVSR